MKLQSQSAWLLLAVVLGAGPVAAQAPAAPAPNGGDRSPPALYAANCAGCHGAKGEGGRSPGLLDELTKQMLQGTIDSIVTPPPGMPKMVPARLSQAEAEAIAAYVRDFH